MTKRKVTIAALVAVGLLALEAGLPVHLSGSQRVGRSGRPVARKTVVTDQGLRTLTEARIATARGPGSGSGRLQKMGVGSGDLFTKIPFGPSG